MKEKVVVLTGGVGGAKLVLGLAQIIAPENIIAITNIGDDFRHLGLAISPDIDTLLYTLAGKANAQQGWGREGESWNFMEVLRSLGGADWFQLGDGDLALHILRTLRLAKGDTLSQIIRDFARAWDVGVNVLPMSDDLVTTYLSTDDGDLAFQNYFVELRCAPVVRSIRFEGASVAKATPGIVDAILGSETEAILIAPSNPYLSVDPILAVPDIRQALLSATAPIVAVSPIIDGKAVKGPTAKLMGELGIAVAPRSIADHYAGLIDGLVIDERDEAEEIEIATASTDTLMIDLADRVRVASTALALARTVS